MGLDMYAYSIPMDFISNDYEVDLNQLPEEPVGSKLAYWRKHSALHDFMTERYQAKGGEAESFNCIAMPITQEDLTLLKSLVQSHTLYHPYQLPTSLYSSADLSQLIASDIIFIRDAQELLDAGMGVYYFSWW